MLPSDSDLQSQVARGQLNPVMFCKVLLAEALGDATGGVRFKNAVLVTRQGNSHGPLSFDSALHGPCPVLCHQGPSRRLCQGPIRETAPPENSMLFLSSACRKVRKKRPSAPRSSS